MNQEENKLVIYWNMEKSVNLKGVVKKDTKVGL